MTPETIAENTLAACRKVAAELLTDPAYNGIIEELTCGGKFSRGQAVGFLAAKFVAEHPEIVL